MSGSIVDGVGGRRAVLSLAGIGAAAAAASVARNALACGPTSPAGTIPVARVTDFATVQLAADSLGCGGILYFPEGTYSFTTPVVVAPNTWVLGAGPGSVLVRAAGGSIFLVEGDVTPLGIRFSNLAFDVNAATFNGAIGIHAVNAAGSCVDMSIEQCLFFTSSAVVSGQSAWAVAIEGGSRLRIRENMVVGLCVCAGATDTGSGVLVQSNHVVGAPRYAIAVLADAGGSIQSTIVEGNIIEDAGGVGILIGPEAEGVLASTMSGVQVRANTITGELPGPGAGILVRIAETTSNVVVEGNIVSNPGTPTGNSYGMLFYAPAGARFDGLAVRGNTVRNVDLAGIHVSCGGDSAVISGNILHSTRGLVVAPYGSWIDQLMVSNNALHSCGVQGILLDSTSGNISSALVCGNQVIDTYGFGAAALRLVSVAENSVEAEVRGNCLSTDGITTYGVLEQGSPLTPTFLKTRYLGNDFRGMPTPFGAVNDAAVIEDNLNVVTDAKGVGTVGTSGATAWIAHGLAFPPGPADVSLTLRSVPESWVGLNAGQVWFELGPSGLRIHAEPPPSAGDSVPLDVAWRVKVRSA